MEKIFFSSQYFNICDTLECGQIFRFERYDNGYKVISQDKCAYAYTQGDQTVVECEEKDVGYFYNFFDLSRDYGYIYDSAISQGVEILTKSAQMGRGIRILNQDPLETLISFVISQNNNIPRIKSIINKLCLNAGEERFFNGEKFYAFPTVEALANKPIEFFKGIGLGYRAEYIKQLAVDLFNGRISVENLNKLSTVDLTKRLLSIYGVGPKVADCVTLFGFHRSDSFPVDTWIAKVYEQDFNGSLTDRAKISASFKQKFKDNAGYFQQYLFHYKRSFDTLNKKNDKSI